ncbi:conserved hypothetical protein [Tenacibaculum maritimum]|uniref:imm11 family protein n=2 Tax=Tenacibaculum maritimum TaxID=107401 RepID=UPI0012E6D21F|nr:DUF1629 domain-containing protein [Tenacibaculum maritimum]CAA0245013.1 conserved hypothetical protein [Tenacibaculum maritimum]
MKYYKIDWDHDNLDVIGNYPQIEFKSDYNIKKNNGIREVKPNKFPDFIPDIELKFHKNAKTTNLIERSSVSFGMYIDNTFKNILEKFKLPKHKYYEIKVYQKDKIYNYYWFHYIIDDFWEWIDKEKSKAIIIDNKKNFQAVAEVDLNLTEDEMKNLFYYELPYYQNPKWEKIVFKNDFPKYDLYETQSVERTTIISDVLLKSLQKANITGYMVKPYTIIEV